MKKLILATLTATLLQGCATQYQHSGFTGGYSETQLDENVFKVSFSGNGYTRRERTADFTLLRSAELTLQKGYKYFSIIDADSYVSNTTYTTPTTSTTTFNVYGSGNYAYGNAQTTTSGGQTYNIAKPSASNTIICFREKPSNGFSYNAEFIYKDIATKYGIRPSGVSNRGLPRRRLGVNLNGMIINKIFVGSVAEKSGLRIGDLILKVDGKTVKRRSDLIHRLRKENSKKIVVIRRGEKTIKVDCVWGK